MTKVSEQEKDFHSSDIDQSDFDRSTLTEYIQNHYQTDPEYPWASYPKHAVFRHASNQKWFAVLMDIAKSKLDLHSENIVTVLNTKLPPDFIGSARQNAGIYPAYHMNKEHWVSIVLSEATAQIVLDCLHESYLCTE